MGTNDGVNRHNKIFNLRKSSKPDSGTEEAFNVRGNNAFLIGVQVGMREVLEHFLNGGYVVAGKPTEVALIATREISARIEEGVAQMRRNGWVPDRFNEHGDWFPRSNDGPHA